MVRVEQTGVVLVPVGSLTDSIGTREISLSKDQPVIVVGRSSRNKSKNLLPDTENAYFDSAVMSRLHAWIKCDDEGKVRWNSFKKNIYFFGFVVALITPL